MATFVHITAAKFEPAIRRSGIGGSKNELFGSRLKRRSVFCFPVLESHTLTHQWTREISKWRRQPLIGVYFRIPDDEAVTCCRLDKSAVRRMTAAEAVALIRSHEDMSGFEVLLHRSVRLNEIMRTAPIRNVIGWRHSPGSRGRAPCACEFCQKGQPNSRRILARAEQAERKLDAERARRISAVEAQIAAHEGKS
jgi:hypothetical protein